MPARTPRAALEIFVDRLSRLAACVTDQPLVATGVNPVRRWRYVAFAPPGVLATLRLPQGGRHQLDLRINYDIERSESDEADFTVQQVAYLYHALDPSGIEMLAYHWHPDSASPVMAPHLHVASAVSWTSSANDRVALAKAHLPTGFVPLADIIRLLIMDVGVVARQRDWRDIVDAARTAR